MFNLWSRVRAASAAAGLRAALRRRSRTAAVLLATAAFGAVGFLGVVGTAAPAYADENGSEWCFLSTGSITVLAGSAPAPSSVPYGTNLTVSWTVNAACPDLAIYMSGPGFNGTEYVTSGPRTDVWATPPNGVHTLTWTLTVLGMDSSTPTPYTMATKTINVT
jgi:hypothetical protein